MRPPAWATHPFHGRGRGTPPDTAHVPSGHSTGGGDRLEAVDFLAELERDDPRALSMLVRHATGETLAEIGAAEGVTEGRVSQILAVNHRRLP